nr:hypothetical protein [Tanacetum cinerariifolium]
MVAYLEKNDDNTEFHQIVDFLSSCSITYALTVSPTIYASYIKQFWNTADSKTVNSVKQIHAIVDGKAVVISELLVRSDLLFDDEDGITCLTNDENFENLALIGYEPLSTKLTFQKDKAVNQEEGDRVERTITTDASLEATQDSDNIIKTQTTTIPNVDIHQGVDTGGNPRRQETMGEGHTSKSREGRLEENIKLADTVPTPHDSPLTGGYTPESDEGKVKETAEHSRDDDDETLTETLLNIKRSSTKDKGKGIMQETELPKKLKKKEMIRLSLDEELAQKLYAEELAKEEARQEQERYNLEKGLDLQRQLDQRKENVPKGDKAKEIDWNDPQNQGGYKQSYFKGMKDREVMKRAGFDLQQGSSKKQMLNQQTKETNEEAKVQGDSDQEVEELKLYMRIILEEDIAIEAIPLAIKPPVIIEYNIVKEGKISTYHITRANGSTRRYTSMINLLENIDREDLETIWKLVKDKY